jgi:hypothetical protein
MTFQSRFECFKELYHDMQKALTSVNAEMAIITAQRNTALAERDTALAERNEARKEFVETSEELKEVSNKYKALRKKFKAEKQVKKESGDGIIRNIIRYESAKPESSVSVEEVRLTPENAHTFIGKSVQFYHNHELITRILIRVSDSGKTGYIDYAPVDNNIELVHRNVTARVLTTAATTSSTIKQTLSIKEAVKLLLQRENIKNRKDLDRWCGDSRNRLYKIIKTMCPEHWDKIKTPEANVRRIYEEILPGYKIHKH